MITDDQDPGSLEGESEEQSPTDDVTGLYAPILNKIPSTLRPSVEPHLKEWSSKANARFQEIHNNYSWAKPYEAYKGIDPQYVEQGLRLVQLLSNNDTARQVYERLKNHFESQGLSAGQAGQAAQQTMQQQDDDWYGPSKEEWDKIQQATQAVSQFALSTLQERQAAEQTAQLDKYITNLGEFAKANNLIWNKTAEEFVLKSMLAGEDGAVALRKWDNVYRQVLQEQSQRNANVPPVLTGTSPAPPTPTKPLSSEERKNLVVKYLESINPR